MLGVPLNGEVVDLDDFVFSITLSPQIVFTCLLLQAKRPFLRVNQLLLEMNT